MSAEQEKVRQLWQGLLEALAVGGSAQLVVGEGQAHIWPLFAPILSEGQQALNELGAFVKMHTS